jgi:hypothetical protein
LIHVSLFLVDFRAGAIGFVSVTGLARVSRRFHQCAKLVGFCTVGFANLAKPL